jgi:RND family efflux transporter MFP subunit
VTISCNSTDSQSQKSTKGQPAIRVEVTPIQRISVQRQAELSGTLVSPDQAKVSSEVAGRVQEVLVEMGREVRPGEVLVKLDPRELEFALRQSEGQLRQTEAQLGMDGLRLNDPPPDEEISTIKTAAANRDDARAQADRATQLIKKGLVSKADYDTAVTRVKVAEAAYQAAAETVASLKATLEQRRAAYELAQKKLSDAIIKTPIGGLVSERLVQPGEFIRENTPVVTIVQMNPLKLRTAIQEKFAAVMRPGLLAQFKVESLPDQVFPGKLAFVSPSVDQATRTFPVEILVDNTDRRLKPGFFTKGVILIQQDQNVLAVPEAAVFTLAGESSVYVIEKNLIRKQPVSLGVRDGKLIEISSGLKGDEILATTRLSELATGVRIVVIDGDTPPQGGREQKPGRGGRGGRV